MLNIMPFPSVKEAVESGEISISTANEIAKLDEEEQEKLVQQGDLGNVTPKGIKQKKVDTSSNFSENDSARKEKPTEKVDTSSNFSENDSARKEKPAEKVDTSSNFSENDSKQEEPIVDTLSGFIYEHYFELETIFTSYMSTTDSDDEIQIVEEFQELLRKVKESERNKIRFGM